MRTDADNPQSNLNAPNSRYLWYRLEPAKRRFLNTLAALDLPVASRAQDPEHTLSFEFLAAIDASR